MAQEVAKLRTKIGVLMKQFLSLGVEKVNAFGTRGKIYGHEELNSEEEAKYLDGEMTSFLSKGQGLTKDTCNLRQGNQG